MGRSWARGAAWLGLALLAVVALGAACGGSDELILATTTSTENSGLLDVLVPRFEEQSGVNVKVVAVGSGAALALGEQGDADVLLVHSPAAEQAFVDAGYGVERRRIMFNDFVIVGPPDDPAGIGSAATAAAAMHAIADAGASFVSRGDDSGTHARERALWDEAGLDVPSDASWYAESGQGMGATLTIAAQTGAYTLSDRATFLAVASPDELAIVIEGDEVLRNVYHVIIVNPDRHDGLNTDAAREFSDFLVAPETQAIISAFGLAEHGQPLFTGDAEPVTSSRRTLEAWAPWT
jgi:tungstate transport system substrate-binding protein